MEIIVAIAIFGFGLWWVFLRTPADTKSSAPYKVELVPAGTEAAIVTPANTESVVVVENAVVPEAVVAEAAPAKAPRKPRVPKAPAAEKPAAKKAAPVKKAAVKKPAARSVIKSKKA